MQRTTRNLARLATVGAMLAGPLPQRKPPICRSIRRRRRRWRRSIRGWCVCACSACCRMRGGSTVNVAGVPSLSSPNSGLSISDQVVPELDISYFFTKNIAAELILGVTRHSISGTGSLANLPIGKTTLLPPTLTLQYHFDQFRRVQAVCRRRRELHRVLQHLGLQYAASQSSVRPRSSPPPPLCTSATPGAARCSSASTTCSTGTGVSTSTSRSSGCGRITAPTVTGLPVTGTAHIDPWLVGAGVTYKF